MSTEGESIGKRLRTLREAAGLSQQALAVKAGLSTSVVSQLEQETKNDPRVSTLLALSRALGCKLADLVDESQPDPAPVEEPPAPKKRKPKA